jgi:hypothetical protein
LQRRPLVDLATYGAQFTGLDAQCRADNDNTGDVVSRSFSFTCYDRFFD